MENINKTKREINKILGNFSDTIFNISDKDDDLKIDYLFSEIKKLHKLLQQLKEQCYSQEGAI